MITLDEILKIRLQKQVNFTGLMHSFREVSIDSRKVNQSCIFIAIKGETKDGHDYIDSVISKKVKLIIVNESWFRKNSNKYKTQAFLVVKDTVKALGELAMIHRGKMNIPVLAIAGSNGKTTTKDIIAEVLSKKFNLHKTEGNFNNHIGLPLTLLGIKKVHDFCILEAGSNHFNELEYLCKIAKQDFSLVTNIGREHLEFFGNLKGVAKEEFEVYDYVFNNGYCNFFNLDDDFIRRYYKNRRKKSFTYSYKFISDVKGIKTGYNKYFNPLISYSYLGKNYRTHVSTFGEHSFYNGLSAIAAGLYFGISPAEISDALSNIRSVSNKRMQVEKVNDITVINDSYNSNPDSVKMGLETVKMYSTKGKKHIVLSDMLEMGKSADKEHAGIGLLAKKLNFDFLYTYGEKSYNTFRAAKKLKNNFYFNDKNDLIEFLNHNLKSNDIVYVKGSRGMEMEKVVKKIMENKIKN
jgi:UDP-N-acetylmuramoyl-tripeptide--D-alanyl-D-alanine ligase